MKTYQVLLIPIIIGAFAGVLLINFQLDTNGDSKQDYLTPSKLIENGSPILGQSNAPITILEWGDYQCTYCYRFHQTSLEVINSEYVKSGKVRIVFKDFPLNGEDSVLAAQATYCAGDQDKYWEYHNTLYNNWKGERTGWINEESLMEFAIEIDLNLQQFKQCLDEKKYLNRVLEMEKFGMDIGIKATPSFLIFDDKKIIKIEGNQPIDVFKNVIDEFQVN